MVRKLNIKESNNRKQFTEADKGYSRSVYQALDDTYVSEFDGKVDPEYISDNVELFIWNTEKNYNEIFNTRRKATSVAYEGLIDLFQLNVKDADVKIRVTSEMVKQWCKKHGINYITMLKPVVDRIEEERAERKAEKKESVRRRYVKEAKSSRKTFTQRELKDMIRRGEAIDITNYSFEDANDLYDRGYDVIGVCRGVYGLNGALLKMRDTGELCAITARNSTLMQLV